MLERVMAEKSHSGVSGQTHALGMELTELQSAKSARRLEQIAGLRARGVGNHVDLPQLVLWGDWSAGKSSVLEGLTGLPFPRQDGLCTRFPTEIILQHTAGETNIIATILPAPSSPQDRTDKMRAYKRRLGTFAELPIAISEAGSLMGVRGFDGVQDGTAFSENVLRIEVSGPIGLHLTMVDLPGIISIPNEEHTAADIQTVHNLVQGYLASPRTITLAVVHAGNDIANQKIIRKSLLVDRAGKRTVYIVTKPDLINEGSEMRIALLAKNQDTTKLNLGIFPVETPAPMELANGIPTEQGQKNEILYSQSPPWKKIGLNMDRDGILALREYLQSLLDQHIERELPKVREEIKTLLDQTEQQIALVGESRPSIARVRVFLSLLATQFDNPPISALNGTYHETDSIFFGGVDGEKNSSRHRAVLLHLNSTISECMRKNGKKRKGMNREPSTGPEDEPEYEIVARPEYKLEDELEDGQMLMGDHEVKAWVREIYIHCRGKELPNNYNNVLLSELFAIQSSRWNAIAEDHVAALCNMLGHMTGDEKVLAELEGITSPRLQGNKKAANAELKRLQQDERQQVITYNYCNTDKVQNARRDATREIIRRAVEESRARDDKLHISNIAMDAEKLLGFLQQHITVNMDKLTRKKARAFYKVALNKYVDSVSMQVIERHLLPDVLCPEVVASQSDDDLMRIASESPRTVEKRKDLQSLHEALEESLRDLR